MSRSCSTITAAALVNLERPTMLGAACIDMLTSAFLYDAANQLINGAREKGGLYAADKEGLNFSVPSGTNPPFPRGAAAASTRR